MQNSQELRGLLERGESLRNKQAKISAQLRRDNRLLGQPEEPSLSAATLPSIRLERSLAQLESQSKKLLHKLSKSGSVYGGSGVAGGSGLSNGGLEYSKAQYLLASHGVDAERIASTLHSIQLSQAFEPLHTIQDTNIEGYLRNEHDLALCGMLEALRNRSAKRHERAFEQMVRKDWEQAKKVIFESLGHRHLSSVSTAAVNNDGMADQQGRAGSSFLDTPLPSKSAKSANPIVTSATSSQDNVQLMQNLSQIVGQLNECRLQNRPAPLAKMFSDSVGVGINKQSQLCWDYLNYLTSVNTLSREREFAPGRSSPYGSSQAVQIRKRILHCSRAMLEGYFMEYLDEHVGRLLKASGSTVQSHRMPPLQKIQLWSREVLMGSVSTAAINNWEIIDGYPFWATIYYLIRSGFHRDALEFAAHYETFLAKTERRFLDYLTAWVTSPDHNLPKHLRAELLNDFNTRIKDVAVNASTYMSSASGMRQGAGLISTMSSVSLDPYKYLLFMIIGRILSDDNAIPPSVVSGLAGGRLGWEDEIWIHLNLVREDGGENVEAKILTESYSLKDAFNRYLSRRPISQWTTQNQAPFRYVIMCFLLGEFESGVRYLWANRLEIDAVHFSLALSYYGLLNISTEFNAIESEIASIVTEESGSEKIEHVVINFVFMLKLYLKRFFNRAVNPVPASQYAFLLCLYQDGYFGAGKGKSESHGEDIKKMLYEWHIETALETGLIDDFFGSFASDLASSSGIEMRQPGFLDKYWPLIGIYSWDDFKSLVIKPAAAKAEKYSYRRSALEVSSAVSQQAKVGRSDDEVQENNAILLYNLAEEYDTILEMLSRKLTIGLNGCGLEGAAEIIYNSLSKRDLDGIFPNYKAEVEKLQKLAGPISSVLDYYLSRPSIVRKISVSKRATLLTLVNLAEIFKVVFQVAGSFVEHLSLERGYPSFDVQSQGVGMRVRLGSGVHSQLWRKALAMLDDIGLVPLGFSSSAYQNHQKRSSDKSFMSGSSTMFPSTPVPFGGGGRSTPAPQRTQSALFGTAPITADSSFMTMTSDLDYSALSSRAELLQTEFSDSVHSQLPMAFLAAEMLLLIGWFDVKSGETTALSDGDGSEITRKSRQLLSLVSSVSRWFKIPSHIHRLVVAMDEVMA